MNDYLVKPYNPAQIYQALANSVNIRYSSLNEPFYRSVGNLKKALIRDDEYGHKDSLAVTAYPNPLFGSKKIRYDTSHSMENKTLQESSNLNEAINQLSELTTAYQSLPNHDPSYIDTIQNDLQKLPTHVNPLQCVQTHIHLLQEVLSTFYSTMGQKY